MAQAAQMVGALQSWPLSRGGQLPGARLLRVWGWLRVQWGAMRWREEPEHGLPAMAWPLALRWQRAQRYRESTGRWAAQ